MDERVMVVPTRLFHQLGHFQGFCPAVENYFAPLTDASNTSYRPRREVEEDPSFKQLIPYVLFEHVGAGRPTLFQYTRGSGQGEGRLHAKRSVGIGGHISSHDDVLSNAGDQNESATPYEIGLRRELDEEVSISTPYTAKCVGLINDDETPVGQVHLGVVYVYTCETPAVAPREDEMIETGFVPVGELLADLERFESWSRICLEAIYGDPSSGTSSKTPTAGRVVSKS